MRCFSTMDSTASLRCALRGKSTVDATSSPPILGWTRCGPRRDGLRRAAAWAVPIPEEKEGRQQKGSKDGKCESADE